MCGVGGGGCVGVGGVWVCLVSSGKQIRRSGRIGLCRGILHSHETMRLLSPLPLPLFFREGPGGGGERVTFEKCK